MAGFKTGLVHPPFPELPHAFSERPHPRQNHRVSGQDALRVGRQVHLCPDLLHGTRHRERVAGVVVHNRDFQSITPFVEALPLLLLASPLRRATAIAFTPDSTLWWAFAP